MNMNFKFRKNYYKIIIGTLICLLLGFLYLGNYNLVENIDNKDIIAMSKELKSSDNKNVDEHQKKTNISDAQRTKVYDANNMVHAENGGYDPNSSSSKSILGAQDLKAKLIGKNTYNK